MRRLDAESTASLAAEGSFTTAMRSRTLTLQLEAAVGIACWG
jgi:hypothetical protein